MHIRMAEDLDGIKLLQSAGNQTERPQAVRNPEPKTNEKSVDARFYMDSALPAINTGSSALSQPLAKPTC